MPTDRPQDSRFPRDPRLMGRAGEPHARADDANKWIFEANECLEIPEQRSSWRDSSSQTGEDVGVDPSLVSTLLADEALRRLVIEVARVELEEEYSAGSDSVAHVGGPTADRLAENGLASVGAGSPGLAPTIRQAAIRAFSESLAFDESSNVLNGAGSNGVSPSLRLVTVSNRKAESNREADEKQSSAAASERSAGKANTSFPWIRIAALVLVAVGTAALWVGSTPTKAEAGLSLQRIGRLSHRGAVWSLPSIEPARIAHKGESFTPREDEWVSVGLTHESMVVVGTGDRVRVVPAEEVFASFDVDSIEANRHTKALGASIRPGQGMLRLEAGEARIACKPGEPVVLAIGTAGVLVVDYGAVHVVLESGLAHPIESGRSTARIASDVSAPLIALAPRSRAEFYPSGRSNTDSSTASSEVSSTNDATYESFVLCAGARALVGDGFVEPVGAADLSLFRELRFFGGHVPRPLAQPRVHPRRFRVGGVVARTGRHEVSLGYRRSTKRDSERKQPETHAAYYIARLSYRPPPALADAQSIRVELRAPKGAAAWLLREPIALKDLRVLKSPPASAVVNDANTASHEPSTAHFELALPRGWYAALNGRPLEIALWLPVSRAVQNQGSGTPSSRPSRFGRLGVFDGVTFVLEEGDGVYDTPRNDSNPCSIPSGNEPASTTKRRNS